MSDLYDGVFLRGVSGGPHSGYLHGFLHTQGVKGTPFLVEKGVKEGKRIMVMGKDQMIRALSPAMCTVLLD